MSISEQSGLHKLRRFVDQRSHMEQHAKDLDVALDVLMERTYALAPTRTANYELNRVARNNARVRERLLEQAIWGRFQRKAGEKVGPSVLKGICEYVQSYQVPLKNMQTDSSWGMIDLVAELDVHYETGEQADEIFDD